MPLRGGFNVMKYCDRWTWAVVYLWWMPTSSVYSPKTLYSMPGNAWWVLKVTELRTSANMRIAKGGLRLRSNTTTSSNRGKQMLWFVQVSGTGPAGYLCSTTYQCFRLSCQASPTRLLCRFLTASPLPCVRSTYSLMLNDSDVRSLPQFTPVHWLHSPQLERRQPHHLNDVRYVLFILAVHRLLCSNVRKILEPSIGMDQHLLACLSITYLNSTRWSVATARDYSASSEGSAEPSRYIDIHRSRDCTEKSCDISSLVYSW